jgi:hypothetical protein
MTNRTAPFRLVIGLAGVVAAGALLVTGEVAGGFWILLVSGFVVATSARGLLGRGKVRTPDARRRRLGYESVFVGLVAVALILNGFALLLGVVTPSSGSRVVLSVVSFAGAAAFIFGVVAVSREVHR